MMDIFRTVYVLIMVFAAFGGAFLMSAAWWLLFTKRNDTASTIGLLAAFTLIAALFLAGMGGKLFGATP